MKKIYISAFVLIISASAFSQEDSSKAKELNEIVVTGQYKPQSVKNSVYQVRTINNEIIRLGGATTVQQVLDVQLGFRFSNDNTLGISDVELMGMGGRSVKILLDGVPVIDRNDARESLNQIDINTIDRIEIINGPMSVSYGSDALAGVINIITKKNYKNGFSVNAKAQEETSGDEYYPFSYKGVHQQSVNVSWKKNEWNISGGGSRNDYDGFGGDDYGRGKTWKPKEQWLGNVRVGYGNSRYNLYYRLDGLHEDISVRGPININTYRAKDQSYVTDRFMHQVQGDWRINNKVQLNGLASYTDYKRATKTVIRDFEKGTSQLSTAEGEQDVSKFNDFVFRSTLQYSISSIVSLQPGVEINRQAASGARIAGSPAITDYALFISSEIKPISKLNIRPGLRFIHNSVYDAPPVIPSLNAKWVLNKSLDLRFAYAYGFRAPALRELYFDFHDANHDIIGNPNLKAEHSNSFTGSLSWSAKKNGVRFTSTLEGFYNQYKNLINFAVNPANTSQFITVNIDQFKTTGGTWENKVDVKNLSATMGFSYIGRYNSFSADDEFKNENLPTFVWTPEVNTNIIYTFIKTKTSLALFYKFTGKRPGYEVVTNTTTGKDEVHLTEIASFNWADFTVTQPVYKYFTVTAGVKNIFDVTDLNNTSASGGIHTSGGPVAMSYGRSYFVGLAFQWNKK